jgi:hypothetical protein
MDNKKQRQSMILYLIVALALIFGLNLQGRRRPGRG